MVFKHKFILYSALVISLLSFSCKEKGGKNIDQGEIYYTLTYTEYSGPIPEKFMPKNLVVSFKKDKILFEIVSPFGDSGIRILSNPEAGIFDTYISMTSSRYYYPLSSGESLPGLEAMDGMEINETSKTSLICGFNCKNAEVTFPADRQKIYNIWYTDEIDIKNPNASTPFSEIDGVLLSFFFIVGKSEMHFNAEAIYKKVVSDKTFKRQPDFRRITRQDFSKVMKEIVSY